jgi:predicted metal-dependent hydrolase
LNDTELRCVEVNGGRIEYQLRRAHRKTLSISVEPNRAVVVIAPALAEIEAVDSRVRRRATWIRRQQQFFDTLPPQNAPRRWISGESHRYLGRQYRLKLVQGPSSSVRLVGGFFVVTTPDVLDKSAIEEMMAEWYRAHARELLPKRVTQLLVRTTWIRMPRAPQLTLRRMRLRWGSTTPGGRVCLNVDLVKLPLGCIDYVVAHELVHTQVPNHGARFWQLLGRVYPEWQTWRGRLERQEI